MVDSQPEEKWHIRMVRPGLPGLDKLPDLGLPDISRLPWLNHPIRPADIGTELRDAMLARENMLEDVNYQKVVPNLFVVEVSQENYTRQFRPIERQIIQQWRERLLSDLVTANSRRGRKEFRFGGRLKLEVRPASDLNEKEARILCRVSQEVTATRSVPGGQHRRSEPPKSSAPPVVSGQVEPPPAARPYVAPPLRPGANPPPSTHPDRLRGAPPSGKERSPASGSGATNSGGSTGRGATGSGGAIGNSGANSGGAATGVYLELVPSGQRWPLYPGKNTIGRSEVCQVYLDMPVVQEKRLVSGQHAYIVLADGAATLYDGSPDGRPSANGTYVNLRRVPATGYRLQNGDAIVLAALDPLFPRSDTPGVVTFYFWTEHRS